MPDSNHFFLYYFLTLYNIQTSPKHLSYLFSNDQLSNAYGILECLPRRGFGMVGVESSTLHSQIDELECHLSAAETLQSHSTPQMVAFIKQTQHDQEQAKALMTKVSGILWRKDVFV